ncbi:MAG: hypothetical protein Q7T82_11910 [Armatimonadota bacterium]|nr:hypothetical protein [Armatimonadota bacterium]
MKQSRFQRRIILTLFALSICATAMANPVGPDPASVRGSRHKASKHASVNMRRLAAQEAAAPRPVAPAAVHSPLPVPGDLPVPAEAQASYEPSALTPEPEGAPPPFSPAPAASFAALGDNNTRIPPDTHGAAGPNHLMVTLNTEVRIQNRGGTNLSTVSLQSFWSSMGPFYTGAGAFDPKVLYDPYGGRWIFTACAEPRHNNSSVLIGVSANSDPTGTWYLYRVDADSTNTLWADYPSIGFNKDWIVVQVNMFAVSDDAFTRSNIYVFDKANLYANGSGAYTLLQDTSGGACQAPAITHDNTIATEYLMETWNSNSGGYGYLRLSKITGAVGSETLTTGLAYPAVATTWNGGVNNDFAPQSGASNKIMANDDRMQNCVYRNGYLWCAHSVFFPATTPTRSSVMWWQVSTSGTVQQNGLVDDASGATFYAFPSIAVNQYNDALIGYSRFSSSQYASANYSYRAGGDAANTLQADTVLKAGEATYYKTFSGTKNRWGDFSATCVDPNNDTDLWTIQEYAATPSGGVDRWGTWWGMVQGTGGAIYVSGFVRDGGGNPMPGVPMNGLPGNPPTDPAGFYNVQVPLGWSGTVTPAWPCTTFTPPSRTYFNLAASQMNQDYVGQPQMFTISGYARTADGAPIPGVMMNGLPGAAPTDPTGFYTAMAPCGWAGIVIPMMPCYTFTPPQRMYINVTSNQINQDYTGAPQQFIISGRVTTPMLIPLEGVIMMGLPGNPATGPDGTYSGSVPCGWTGSVNPIKPGLVFDPPMMNYPPVGADQLDQNYFGNDPTPPEMPVVTDDGAFTLTTDQIHAQWLSNDPETGISGYRYAISMDPGPGGIIPGGEWLDVGLSTEDTRTGLALNVGQAYYVIVVAMNGTMMPSPIGFSDGITVVAQAGLSVAAAKLLADTSSVGLTDKSVTAVLTDGFYILDGNKRCGVKVSPLGIPPGLTAGATVDVGGSMQTVNDERCLAQATVTTIGYRWEVPAVMTNRSVGGTDWFYNALTGAGQKGVYSGLGLNTVGLPVLTTGRVVNTSGDSFWLDDGSGAISDSGQAGVKVFAPGLSIPAQDHSAAVVGVCTSYVDNGELYPLIRVRSQADLMPLN